jgi:hypothetical protein
MPDCQRITHRLAQRRAHYRSTRELQLILTGAG